MEELLLGALVKAVELSPAITILVWQAWAAERRARECLEHLLNILETQ